MLQACWVFHLVICYPWRQFQNSCLLLAESIESLYLPIKIWEYIPPKLLPPVCHISLRSDYKCDVRSPCRDSGQSGKSWTSLWNNPTLSRLSFLDGSYSRKSSWSLNKLLFSYCCSDTVVSVSLLLCPLAPPTPTSHPQTYPPLALSMVLYTCSLMSLPHFPPLSLPSGYCRSVLYFHVSGSACLFGFD